jgi:hypothetical protein
MTDYERAGFTEPRELARDVQGYVLTLVDDRRARSWDGC